MNPDAVKRAGLYARISQAVEDTDKVENQLARLRAAAREAGYAVAGEFSDDDISAYQGKLERPGWTALLAAQDAGELDVVMATEPERLTRGSATQLEALQVLMVRNGAVLHTLSVGVQGPASPAIRAFMQIGGLEVATKTQRQNARNQDELTAGRALWGQRRFGFEDRHTLRESEAQVILDAYRAVFAGATLYGIAKAWNDAGVKTARAGITVKRDGNTRTVSGLWTTNTVKKVLTNPSTAGILVHRGVEQPKSELPAIVSREDYDQATGDAKDYAQTYTADSSIRRWGIRGDDLDTSLYTGPGHETDLQKRASEVMSDLARPAYQVSSLSFNVRSNKSVMDAIDLHRMVTVLYEGRPQRCRVLSITETITPTRWGVDLEFTNISAGATYGYFTDKYSGTYADFATKWAGKTYRDFNANPLA